jgi:amino acid transporter
VILMALVGLRPQDLWPGAKEGKAKWIVVLLAVFIGALIFFGAGGYLLVGVPTWAASTDFWTIIFFVIILAIVVFWMGAEGEKKTGEGAAPAK